jgi:hypothetical protein
LEEFLVFFFIILFSIFFFSGPTVENKAIVLHYGRASPHRAIDPNTKKEVSLFGVWFADVYRDVPSDGTSHVTWKENNVWSWNYKFHLKEGD